MIFAVMTGSSYDTAAIMSTIYHIMVCLQRKVAHLSPLYEAFYCVLSMFYVLTLLPLSMSVARAANSFIRAGILVFISKLCY